MIELDEDVRDQKFVWRLGDGRVAVNLIVDKFLIPCGFYADIVVLIQSPMRHLLQMIASQLPVDTGPLHQLFDVIEIPNLARLIDPVGFLVEPFKVVKLEAFGCRVSVANQQEKCYNSCSSPSFAVIAVNGHDVLFALYVNKALPLRNENISKPTLMSVSSVGA